MRAGMTPGGGTTAEATRMERDQRPGCRPGGEDRRDDYGRRRRARRSHRLAAKATKPMDPTTTAVYGGQ